jgi:hypothetical protein
LILSGEEGGGRAISIGNVKTDILPEGQFVMSDTMNADPVFYFTVFTTTFIERPIGRRRPLFLVLVGQAIG